MLTYCNLFFAENSLPSAIICCTPIIFEYNALIAPILEVSHLGA